MSKSRIQSALLSVQRRLRPAKRNRDGEIDGREFTYADLSSVIDAARPMLLKLGVLTVQHASGLMEGPAFMAHVHTRLIHVKSGEEFDGGVASCPCRHDRQEYAATVTVLRRVGLASLLGIVQAEEQMGMTAHEIVNAKRAEAGK